MVQRVSRSKAGRGGRIVGTAVELRKSLFGQKEGREENTIVASGLFEQCITAIEAVAAAGTEGVHDVDGFAITMSLNVLKDCRNQDGCERRIRSIGSALSFCLENDFDVAAALGVTSGAVAAQLCCASSDHM